MPRRTRIRPRSTKLADRMAIYRPLRDAYLAEHQWCTYPGCRARSVDVHHRRGRVGDLLFDRCHWSALCRTHHDWVGEHPTEALELGLSERRLGR